MVRKGENKVQRVIPEPLKPVGCIQAERDHRRVQRQRKPAVIPAVPDPAETLTLQLRQLGQLLLILLLLLLEGHADRVCLGSAAVDDRLDEAVVCRADLDSVRGVGAGV